MVMAWREQKKPVPPSKGSTGESYCDGEEISGRRFNYATRPSNRAPARSSRASIVGSGTNYIGAGTAELKDGQWGSLWIRKFGNEEYGALHSNWPLPRPRKWIAYVNQPANHAQRDAIRPSCRRGSTYGSAAWVKQSARKIWIGIDAATPWQTEAVILDLSPFVSPVFHTGAFSGGQTAF